MAARNIRIGLVTISLLLIISPTSIDAEPAAASGDEAGRLLQIVLLKERDLPSRGSNIDVEPLLSGRADVRLTVVDAGEIVRNGVHGDVFCNGHGEVYPVEIENRLFQFLQGGGGLLHLGGAPFETAMKRQGGKWVEVVRRMEERSLPLRAESEGPKKEPFDMFRRDLE